MTGYNQSAVATQMANYANRKNISFVVALGDNFYENGVQNDTDPLWTLAYTDVYTSSSLQIPWHSVLGNHDYYGNPQAEIDYYVNKRDNRWNMPSHVYTKIWSIDTSTTIQIVRWLK